MDHLSTDTRRYNSNSGYSESTGQEIASPLSLADMFPFHSKMLKVIGSSRQTDDAAMSGTPPGAGLREEHTSMGKCHLGG